MTRDELIDLVTAEVVQALGGQQKHLDAKPMAEPTPAAPTKATDSLLERMKAGTSARIAVGHCGPRLPTAALLDFRADHAAARDAVLTHVEADFISRCGLFSVSSRCRDKNEYLTRPDLGRLLCPAGEKLLLERCQRGPQVQIFAAGGLSSVSVQANLEQILPLLNDALRVKGIRVGTPFYARFARVGLEDAVAKLLDAEVVCVLIGERPGLKTAESMSAYIAYRAEPGMAESRRTVVSNIHKNGTNAMEAGAYIADLIAEILRQRASGVELVR